MAEVSSHSELPDSAATLERGAKGRTFDSKWLHEQPTITC